MRTSFLLLLIVLLLPAFAHADNARIDLSWTPPTRNADSSPLLDLAGYRVYYGRRSGAYDQNVRIGAVTRYQLDHLLYETTYYLTITAIDRSGHESAFAAEQAVRTVSSPFSSIAPASTNLSLPDSDSDGVSDRVEISEGSDPYDHGSVLRRSLGDVCSLWNTVFPGVWKIFENENRTSLDYDVTTRAFDSLGSLLQLERFGIGSFGRNDMLYHERAELPASSEGLVCSSYSVTPGALGARMTSYLPETHPEKLRQFQFAISQEASSGLIGAQVIPVNTFHPGAGLGDSAKAIASWVHLSNLENTVEAGTLYVYNQDGKLLMEHELEFEPREVKSFGMHELGVQWYGMARWIPKSAASRFTLHSFRYYFDNPWGLLGFDGALPLEGSAPNGREQYVVADTIGRSAVLELINGSSSAVTADVRVDGIELAIPLLPFGSYHLLLDPYIGVSKFSSVSVRSDVAESLTAVAVHYARDGQGELRYAYAMRASEPLAQELSGTYNTHLGQSPWLLLHTTKPQDVRLVIKRTDGYGIADVRFPVTGVHAIDLSQYEVAGQTGVMVLIPDRARTLTAWALRVKPWEYVIPTELR